MKKLDREIIYYTNQIINPTMNIYQVFNAYHNRGILYFKKKFYKKAIDDFASAIERSSYMGCWSPLISAREYNYIKSKNFFLRGIAYIKINNLDKGIDDFNKALDLDSEVIEKNKLELSILPLEIIGLIKIFFDV